MKILHVITRSDLGGAQSVVINLANSMCQDHEIAIAAGEDGPMWSALDNRIKKIKISEIVRNVSIVKDLIALFKLRNLYRKFRPDVIHLHSSKIGFLGRLAFPKDKIVYSVHGFDSIRVAYKKFLPLERVLKNRCKAIVLASEYDKKNIINEGITKNLFIVYNGVKEPKLQSDLFLKDFGGKKVVMCIARVSPQKRFDSFLEIAALLPEYAFVWIGTDKDYAHKLADNVFCIPAVPNAKKYIQLADLFILPTNYEGIPIVLVDALSYGKPIISSDVGGISEIVLNNENGFTIPNDNGIFAEKINYILSNENVMNKFAENSLERYCSKFTIKNMVTDYLEIYKI